jgi:hypothetical protein
VVALNQKPCQESGKGKLDSCKASRRCETVSGDLVFWNRTLGLSMIAGDHEAEVLRRPCTGQATVIEDGKVVQRGVWRIFIVTLRPATAFAFGPTLIRGC